MAVAPVLKSTKKNPYPSAPQATHAVNTAIGPALKPTGIRKTVGKLGPVGKNAPTGKGPMRILRGPRMARRVGVPIVNRSKPGNPQVQKMLTQARKNLAGPKAKPVTTEAKHGRTVTREAGKTTIKGKNKSWVVTQRGLTARNKALGAVTKTKLLGPEGSPGSKIKKVRVTGKGTKTKADDTRLVKVRGPNRARLTYNKAGGPTTTVSRKAAAPRKVKVAIKGKAGTKTKVIGPKLTRITGPGGKTRTVKTRYISQKRRETVTPKIGQPGWRRGNTKRRKSNLPAAKTPTATPTKKSATGGQASGNTVRGNWRNIARFRRLRRRQGARYNQSITKGQLKNVTSRRLA